ncbi:GNAT family N-acetyltransferase [Longimicrobium sp.]|uniref:GNAT family N-acetyltransferase n=1 Tax=Longimicrobium sp. TaxID=2029185 RepID=UPI002C35875F|nr:GNAT family N-acetyltransferase [Longimicrobium sp.]HSU16104.1 GNAT family N-acetyltransferase [Longimicrobium sp.]
MRIRPVQPGDRAEWLRMLRALYDGTVEADHAEDVDGFLAARPAGRPHTQAVFVCEREDGALCGLLELSLRNYAEGCEGETPYVESWFVDADVRGRGIGALLMRAADAWARERGYTEIASDTLLDNHASERAHLAVGFEEVERTIHFRKSLAP